MDIITDSLGSWEQLGTLNLSLDWQLMAEEAFNNFLFRFTYNVDWDVWENQPGGKTCALGRFYYPVGDNTVVSPSFKLFPKQQKEIRQLSIPQEFIDNGIITRTLGFKQVRTPWYSVVSVIPWSLGVEYLVS